ncbi:2-iminobutanoate/2-iminopropanoate deaminase-like [Oppia nitens]|uniref:2-iminobutanoate/2-iminopropanoate deaminase-like n=1 Tax=Oppia nitens TaxID=1686743 RepID=UPI0023DAADAB|nr:2-iminobutanoate/2-iminopropanoate deaminase-like [Oppia nitens]
MFNVKHQVSTPLAQQPIGPFSQAIRSDNRVYISGQIAYNVKTSKLVLNPIEAQVDQIFNNIKAVAEASGATLDHIVKINVFITDFKYLSAINSSIEKHFRYPYPSRTTVQVASLPMAVDVEIEAILSLTHNDISKL